jgi:hypothetical protein
LGPKKWREADGEIFTFDHAKMGGNGKQLRNNRVLSARKMRLKEPQNARLE